MTKRDLLTEAYAAFNRRDIDAVLELMTEDVDWPNAMEGTMVHGKDAVRDYWKHQWEVADPLVEPISITDGPDGTTVVHVNQIVKTLDGTVISEGMLDHEYRIENGLIARMDVKDEAPGNRFTPAGS
ncbi:nuclear transport factor 2 family protein [bacterium]|nr:MAG: nuclear transport factor 2 family protein [bacterium]